MKILLVIILGVPLSYGVSAQDYEVLRDSFLKDIVLGDTINLKTLPKKAISIEAHELFEHIVYERHSLMELSMYDTILSFLDTVSVPQRAGIVQQIEINNEFKWKDLASTHFYLFNRKEKYKGCESYSLPIFYSKHKALIYHSWCYSSHYAGMSIDFWEYKNEKWEKIKPQVLWMN